MKKKLILFLLCGASLVAYPNFETNPLLNGRMKAMMKPYLLPLDHPIKPMIDLIFSQGRIVDSKESILDAGFSIIAEMPRSNTFVVKHPFVPGFLFKMHLDTEGAGRFDQPSAEWLANRCYYAAKIRKIIQKNHIRHFVVPDKWLYILPAHPQASQPVILICTEMDLVPVEESKLAWRTAITKEHLDELYLIMKEGCGSWRLGSNVPYTKQGTFAFTDTERPPHKLSKVEKYFSPKMVRYWQKLMDKGS